MAKRYDNDKGFLIIELTQKDAGDVNFGFMYPDGTREFLCGTCNTIIKGNMYYIAALNEVFCKECMEDIVKNYTHYTSGNDLDFEIRHYNNIAQYVGLPPTDEYFDLMSKEELEEYYKDRQADDAINAMKDEVY